MLLHITREDVRARRDWARGSEAALMPAHIRPATRHMLKNILWRDGSHDESASTQSFEQSSPSGGAQQRIAGGRSGDGGPSTHHIEFFVQDPAMFA